MLGCKEGFSFEITEKWRRDKCDAANPMTFVTKPAVMPSKIDVKGSQWVEPRSDGKGSDLKFQLSVKVKIMGVGGTIAKGISDGTMAAYVALPERALEFAALQKNAQKSSTQSTSSADKSRRRWRLALMYVRFFRSASTPREDEPPRSSPLSAFAQGALELANQAALKVQRYVSETRGEAFSATGGGGGGGGGGGVGAAAGAPPKAPTHAEMKAVKAELQEVRGELDEIQNWIEEKQKAEREGCVGSYGGCAMQ